MAENKGSSEQRWRLWHSHRWEPTGVSPREVSAHTLVAGIVVGEPVSMGVKTLVMYTCACGKNKTEDFKGLWTLEQVKNQGGLL